MLWRVTTADGSQAALCLPGRQASVGAVGGRGERAGPAGGVALRRPANGVARGALGVSEGDKHQQADSQESERVGRPLLELAGPTTLLLLLLEFFRWLCSSLVAPSWKVLGRAPSNMVNSGVLSSNRAIKTTWAAWRRHGGGGEEGEHLRRRRRRRRLPLFQQSKDSEKIWHCSKRFWEATSSAPPSEGLLSPGGCTMQEVAEEEAVRTQWNHTGPHGNIMQVVSRDQAETVDFLPAQLQSP